MKVYARTRTIHDEHAGKVPYNVNIANAIQGFHEMGFEIHFYNTVNEIYDLYELGDIVLDGIDQVEYCLAKFGIVPKNIDYPEILQPYMGRKIWTDTINNINTHPELWGCFVKPVKDKAFVGRVINSPKDLVGCGKHDENYEVLCTDAVEFIFECRGFIYYDELIDLRPYKGDWKNMKLMDTDLIEKAVKEFATWDERPMACSLDWGVTKDGKTVLVEMNSAYALGCYGLYSLQYAKMISACISQLSNTKDECNFSKIKF